jgi:hypothetical protein
MDSNVDYSERQDLLESTGCWKKSNLEIGGCRVWIEKIASLTDIIAVGIHLLLLSFHAS